MGPNSSFLDYISRVLPELGETGVVLSTIGGLFPGIEPNHEEDLVAREIKGSDAMVEILSTAVKDYQLLPDAPPRTSSRRPYLKRHAQHGEKRPHTCTPLAQATQ